MPVALAAAIAGVAAAVNLGSIASLHCFNSAAIVLIEESPNTSHDDVDGGRIGAIDPRVQKFT